jgi:hypothetical protein
MANRYYWDGIDLNTLMSQDATSLTSEITSKFGAMQGWVHESGQITNPNNFQSNENNGTYNTSIHKNSFYCYCSDEEDEAPPYFIDRENIFAKDWTTTTNYKKIHVTKVSATSGQGTFNIPIWCNAVKIYFKSKTGSNGAQGGSIGTLNKGGKHNANTNYTDSRFIDNSTGGRNEDRGHSNDHRQTGNPNDYDRHYNHNKEQWHHNTDITNGASGAAGGTAGACVLGFFTKYAKFTAGTNNTIDYSFSTSAGGTSIATLKQSGTDIVVYKFKNGANGGTGNSAYWSSHGSNNTNTHHDHAAGNDDRRDRTHTRHHNHNWPDNTVRNGSGNSGDGTAGSLDVANTTTGGTKYLAYNDGETTSTGAIIIYYFKYRSTLRNSNPFTWTSYSHYASSGYHDGNLNTRAVTTNSGYDPSDLYWARAQTDTLQYNTDVSPATSTVQQLPSGFPSGHAFYLDSSVNVTLKKFDIYVSNNSLNEPFYPEKLTVYGGNVEGTGGVEIYSGKPNVISDVPDYKSVDYGGSNICNNTTAYRYYFFVIEEIVGPIATSNTYYGLKINYIHPFIQEDI